MPEFILGRETLKDACQKLLSILSGRRPYSEDCVWHFKLTSFDETTFLTAAKGAIRCVFKSRDRDFIAYGLGAADIVYPSTSREGFIQITSRIKTSIAGNFYFSAHKFSDGEFLAEEWADFKPHAFILPLLLVVIEHGQASLYVHFRKLGHLNSFIWLDHAVSLLQTLYKAAPSNSMLPQYVETVCTPSYDQYRDNLKKVLHSFQSNENYKKVVLGRRKTLYFDSFFDPVLVFFQLKEKSPNAFSFFMDMGKESAFFGASPELLYRRCNDIFETESLAGTRPRSPDSLLDNQLGKDLLESQKENYEHALVSMHIENALKKFSAGDIAASKISLMPLSYVQHLVKQYRAHIPQSILDGPMLEELHPTPAVCGVERLWALDFILKNEGFERGYYAGFFGVISSGYTEHTVAIRSALYHQKKIHIYTASGIVAGSKFEAEWSELNNKEKNILHIFDEE